MGAERPAERAEKAEEPRPLGELLAKEALAKCEEVVKEDTEAYRTASHAVGSFIDRSLQAAELMQGELNKDDALPAGSKDRLSAADRRRYEEYMTQAEALAIILPPLLQQARIVQFRPDVQQRLEEVVNILLKREKLLDWLERNRAALLMAAHRRGVPIPHDEIPKLAPIADQAWRLREELMLPIDRKDLQELHDAMAKRAEPAYKEFTDKAGQDLKSAKIVSEVARREAGAQRVTQGLPGAEFVLDTPEQSLAIWQRLLQWGGPNEKKRAARQLREGVSRFDRDFLKQEAYKVFVKTAERQMQIHKRKNQSIRWWTDLFGAKTVGRIATTSDEEFQQVFDAVTAKLREQFDAIGKMPEAAGVTELSKFLERMEKGQPVDEATLTKGIQDYAVMQRRTGELIAAFQRWQVAENIGIIDNPAFGAGSMLEKVTAVGDKTFVGFLQEHSPYGVFRPRSFYDVHTGRLVLVSTARAPSDLSVVDHLKESGKIVGAAITVPVLRRILARIPYLGQPLRGAVGRLVASVAIAEASLEIAKEAAAVETQKGALKGVEQTLKFLSEHTGALKPAQVREQADLLFAGLVVLLHAAQSKDPQDVDHILALEAHVYTNQLLTALGYPPHHEMQETVIPKSPDAIPAKQRSPELVDYLTTRRKDEEKMRAMHRKDREVRREIHQRVHGRLRELGANVRTDVPKEDPISAIWHERLVTYPPTPPGARQVALHLEMALAAPEMTEKGGHIDQGAQRLGESAEQRTAEAFRIAGETFYTHMRLVTLSEVYRRKFGREVGWNEMPQGELSAKGFRFDKEQMQESVRQLVHGTPLSTVLAVARELREHEPTDEQICAFWTHTEYRGWTREKTMLDNRFGKQGSRSGMAQQFLQQWAELRVFTDLYRDDLKTERADPIDAARPQKRIPFKTDRVIVALPRPRYHAAVLGTNGAKLAEFSLARSSFAWAGHEGAMNGTCAFWEPGKDVSEPPSFTIMFEHQPEARRVSVYGEGERFLNNRLGPVNAEKYWELGTGLSWNLNPMFSLQEGMWKVRWKKSQSWMDADPGMDIPSGKGHDETREVLSRLQEINSLGEKK